MGALAAPPKPPRRRGPQPPYTPMSNRKFVPECGAVRVPLTLPHSVTALSGPFGAEGFSPPIFWGGGERVGGLERGAFSPRAFALWPRWGHSPKPPLGSGGRPLSPPRGRFTPPVKADFGESMALL